MEGLSAAASGIAVASIAMQLAESFKKLCDFWKSIQNAPENIRAISIDLELLSSVLTRLAYETQHIEPDATLIAVLKGCDIRLKTLTTLLHHMEPGFSSTKPRVRKWTALKAVMKQGELMKFQEALDSLKGTLLLALQGQCSRLSRIRQNSLESGLATITSNISRLSVDHDLDIARSHSFVASDYFHGGQNSTGNSAEKVYIGSREYPTSGQDWSVPQKEEMVTRTLAVTKSVLEGFLGTIRARSTTTLQCSKQTADITLEQDHLEYETSYIISPASWLVRLGFQYGLHLSLLSSTWGWKNTLKPFCLVPDDALIFEFCKQGNIPAVRSLLSRGYASVKDTDSKGYTPLHFAADRHHPELCQILKSAGADTNLLTHYAETPVYLASSYSAFFDANLTDVMDTFRVLMNSMDFSVEDANGWQVLKRLCFSAEYEREYSRVNYDLLNWMLQMLRFELRTNVIRSEYAKLLGLILKPEPELVGAVDLFLNLGGPSIIDADTTSNFGTCSVLHIALAQGDREEVLSTVLARNPNLHRLCSCAGLSPLIESPTSLAMYSSVAFRSWLHALVKTGLDIGSFIDQELVQDPQVHVGWEKETLLNLFTHGDRPDLHFDYESACSDCKCWPSFLGPMVQPYWMHLLERVKEGLYPYDPTPTNSKVNEDENANLRSVGDAPSSLIDVTLLPDTTENDPLGNLHEVLSESEPEDHNSQHSDISQTELDYGKHEAVCIGCWLSYEETGIRGLLNDLHNGRNTSLSEDSSENEYSPFHIHS